MKRVWCQLKLKEVESKSIWGGSEYRGFYILECVKVCNMIHLLQCVECNIVLSAGMG